MSTLAERMTALVEERAKQTKETTGRVIAQLAAHCGIKPPSVYNWLDGTTKNLAGTNLMSAATFFDVNFQWLATGKGKRAMLIPKVGEPPSSYGVSEDEYVLIEELTNHLGAGDGQNLLDFDEVDGQRAYRRDWIEKNKFNVHSLKLLQVRGDSMVPYLFDGNKVLINTADRRIVDGEHYAIRIGDQRKVKRLFTQGDGKIRVESYNAPTDYITPNDDAEILGLVVDRNGTSRGRR